MMFDLRKNAFFMLGLTPQSTRAEIAEAFDEVALEKPEIEPDLRVAQNNLFAPNKRLLEELTFLWDVPFAHWEQLFDNMSAFWKLPLIARMNMAAHYCSSLSADTNDAKSQAFVQPAIFALVVGKNTYGEMFEVIKENRKKAQFPPPQESHYNEAIETISEGHRKAAIYAVEQSRKGRLIMAEILKQWRYENTRAGRFVMDLCRDYERWSIDKISYVEEEIQQVIVTLLDVVQQAEVELVENSASLKLDELEDLLYKWDEYSRPIQLMYEAKGLDYHRPNGILDMLRHLPQQPGITGQIESEIKILKSWLQKQNR